MPVPVLVHVPDSYLLSSKCLPTSRYCKRVRQTGTVNGYCKRDDGIRPASRRRSSVDASCQRRRQRRRGAGGDARAGHVGGRVDAASIRRRYGLRVSGSCIYMAGESRVCGYGAMVRCGDTAWLCGMVVWYGGTSGGVAWCVCSGVSAGPGKGAVVRLYSGTAGRPRYGAVVQWYGWEYGKAEGAWERTCGCVVVQVWLGAACL